MFQNASKKSKLNSQDTEYGGGENTCCDTAQSRDVRFSAAIPTTSELFWIS